MNQNKEFHWRIGDENQDIFKVSFSRPIRKKYFDIWVHFYARTWCLKLWFWCHEIAEFPNEIFDNRSQCNFVKKLCFFKLKKSQVFQKSLRKNKSFFESNNRSSIRILKFSYIFKHWHDIDEKKILFKLGSSYAV